MADTDEKVNPTYLATDWLTSCDNCISQEGRHYCLLHGQPMRDMDIITCDSWQAKEAA